MRAEKPTVIAVVGPTCTGKTALAIEIARHVNGEIIACDSRTVYRHMNVGTAKPTEEERQGIPHYMFDVADPDQNYTVAQYKDEADRHLKDIFERGKTPVICGGTGFYSRALLEGLQIPAVEPQPQLRAELQQMADEQGNSALHARLREVDAVTADRLNQNDRVRIIRALEVSLVKGLPFSQLISKRPLPFRVLWIGLTVADRSFLRSRIQQRFSEQLQNGLVEEVQSLYAKYGPVRSLRNSVNYTEYLAYFQGECSVEQASEECLKHNNQLARRQLIWFRANPEMNWLEIDGTEKDRLLQLALHLIEQSQI